MARRLVPASLVALVLVGAMASLGMAIAAPRQGTRGAATSLGAVSEAVLVAPTLAAADRPAGRQCVRRF